MAATKKKSSLGKGLNVLFDEAITVTEEINTKENPDYNHNIKAAARGMIKHINEFYF